jgi:NADH:ubiquinone oxidoreductase subunit F (NADH-binding)
MDFSTLRDAGSMLGSAGVVVLNDTVDMVQAALTQAVFFEEESCGQCSPCRIGTQILRQAIERYGNEDPNALAYVQDVAWGMGEASICGLGQAAALPLTSAMKYFPSEFGLASESGGSSTS